MIVFTWRNIFKPIPGVYRYPSDDTGRGCLDLAWLWFSLTYFTERTEFDMTCAGLCAYKDWLGLRETLDELYAEYRKNRKVIEGR